MTTEQFTSNAVFINPSENLDEQYKAIMERKKLAKEKLEELINQQCHIESKLRNISLVIPRLNSIQSNAKHLVETIQFTSTLADSVSAKVRELDLAKGRVSECQQRVNDILDLQLCREGVISSMKIEDYEKAAAHMHRFLLIDETALKLTAGDVAQGPTVDSSLSLLHEAKDHLQRVLQDKMDEAIADGDAASVERFFKIFPLLNMHDEGLKKFSSYQAVKLKENLPKALRQVTSAESNARAAVKYADALTVLLEDVARIIEIHQPLVETFYGPGRLLDVLMILQPECDRQANQILAEFRKDRQIDKKIRLVSEALSANANTARSNPEKCDPRELDAVLAELTLLSSRTELYLRFVRRRITSDVEVETQVEEVRHEKSSRLERLIRGKGSLSHGIEELLCQYILLERYFLLESVSKAVSMDTSLDGSLTSSVVDDVFFLVKKSIRRGLSSGSVDSVCAVINNVCTLLEEDYSAVFRQQCKQGFPSGYLDLAQAYNVIQSSLQQGSIRLQTSDTEKAKANFLITLNNIETSVEGIEALEKTLGADIQSNFLSHIGVKDKQKLQSCLEGLKVTAKKFRELSDFGHEQLKSSAINPRIKPWVDKFLSVNHDIDEEEFSCYEAQDPFVQELIIHLDGFITGFKDSLTPNNYQRLIGTLTSQVAQRFEKVILKINFSKLGALHLDREVRALVAYLTSATTWTIRDRLTRLTQMVTLLNLETLLEIDEYWGPNSGSITWRLTAAEVRQVLLLRTDFRSEDVKRLKL